VSLRTPEGGEAILTRISNSNKIASLRPSDSARNDTNSLGSQIVREIVIPELTTEINEGKNFAQLRQVYNSLILATWYKKKIKDSILAQVYADKNKVAGVTINDVGAGSKPALGRAPTRGAPTEILDTNAIYKRYLKAFKKGVYNYIKEEQDPVTQEVIPRKYFSGGATFLGLGNKAMVTTSDSGMLSKAFNRFANMLMLGVVLITSGDVPQLKINDATSRGEHALKSKAETKLANRVIGELGININDNGTRAMVANSGERGQSTSTNDFAMRSSELIKTDWVATLELLLKVYRIPAGSPVADKVSSLINKIKLFPDKEARYFDFSKTLIQQRKNLIKNPDNKPPDLMILLDLRSIEDEMDSVIRKSSNLEKDLLPETLSILFGDRSIRGQLGSRMELAGSVLIREYFNNDKIEADIIRSLQEWQELWLPFAGNIEGFLEFLEKRFLSKAESLSFDDFRQTARKQMTSIGNIKEGSIIIASENDYLLWAFSGVKLTEGLPRGVHIIVGNGFDENHSLILLKNQPNDFKFIKTLVHEIAHTQQVRGGYQKTYFDIVLSEGFQVFREYEILNQLRNLDSDFGRKVKKTIEAAVTPAIYIMQSKESDILWDLINDENGYATESFWVKALIEFLGNKRAIEQFYFNGDSSLLFKSLGQAKYQIITKFINGIESIRSKTGNRNLRKMIYAIVINILGRDIKSYPVSIRTIFIETINKLVDKLSRYSEPDDIQQKSNRIVDLLFACMNRQIRVSEMVNALHVSLDSAMLGDSKRGGIDLTSNQFLQTQNSGGEIKFHVDPAMMAQLQASPGFEARVISIQPMNNLRDFLGVLENEKSSNSQLTG